MKNSVNLVIEEACKRVDEKCVIRVGSEEMTVAEVHRCLSMGLDFDPCRSGRIFVMVSGADYIPAGNGPFYFWQQNWVTKVNLYISGWDLSQNALAEWQLLSNTQGVKKLAYEAAWLIVSSGEYTDTQHQAFEDARKSYESGDTNNPQDTSIRLFYKRYIVNNRYVTNAQKEDIGTTVPKSTSVAPVSSTAKTIASPELTPVVKRYARLEHTIQAVEPGTKSYALPKGIDSYDVFLVVTELSVTVPPAVSAYTYVGQIKRGFYTQTFDEAQEGKRAWYIIRIKIKGVYKKTTAPISAIIP